MKEFLSEEELQNYLESGDFYQSDFTIDRKCYLLICEVRNNTTYTLFTDKEFDAFMIDNMCVSGRDLVEKLANQIGRSCMINLKQFYVGGDHLDDGWCILGHGILRCGVFRVDFE